MSAVADEQVAIYIHAGGAQRVHFLDEGEGIEHNSVADDTTATLAQHAAGDELKDELFALDGDGVPGIVAAGITRHQVEALGEDVDNFAFAFVTPLRADDHRCLASFQIVLHPRLAFGRKLPRGCAHNSSLDGTVNPKFGEISMRSHWPRPALASLRGVVTPNIPFIVRMRA